MSSYYDTAQICMNGHLITSIAQKAPELQSKYCKMCGQPTIMQCMKCNSNIRGHYHVPGVISPSFTYAVPTFCNNCGEPYPWTKAILDAAKEMIMEMEELGDYDKERLEMNITDIIIETPRTSVAATIIKKSLDKVSPVGKEMFKKLLFDLSVEAAKHLIWK